MVRVRIAALKRDGAWSGKASDILNSAASGRKRRIARSTTMSTNVEAPVSRTHHTAVSSTPEGRSTIWLTTATKTTDTAIGVSAVAALMTKAARGRFDHRPPTRSVVGAGTRSYRPISRRMKRTNSPDRTAGQAPPRLGR